MKALILTIAAITLGVWSLFAWGAYGLVGFAEGLGAWSSEFLPIPPELALWLLGLLSGMGGIAVWIVWGLGAAIIAILTLAAVALVGSDRPVRGAPPEGFRQPTIAPDGAPAPTGDEIVARVLGRSRR